MNYNLSRVSNVPSSDDCYTDRMDLIRRVRYGTRDVNMRYSIARSIVRAISECE